MTPTWKTHGLTKMGIVRSTVVIDKKGELVDVFYGVAADGYAQDMLRLVEAL